MDEGRPLASLTRMRDDKDKNALRPSEQRERSS